MFSKALFVRVVKTWDCVVKDYNKIKFTNTNENIATLGKNTPYEKKKCHFTIKSYQRHTP